MRLAGQAQLGFYPIPQTPLTQIIKHLSISAENRDKVCIIDPCCGEGVALKEIRDSLGVKHDRVYAIELDEERASKTRKLMPTARVLGPASFFGTSITSLSYGLVYLNPPFDWDVGGGQREEGRFAERAMRLLVPGGIMVVVAPITAYRNKNFTNTLQAGLEDMRLYSFPSEHRHYQETVLFGTRRTVDLIEASQIYSGYLSTLQVHQHYRTEDPPLESDNQVWTIPPCWAPHRFERNEYLDHELAEDLHNSPLTWIIKPERTAPRARPPLPLNNGHRALLLASGVCDGLVQPHNEEPHVVRGSTKKVEYVSSSTEETDPETGATKKVTVISQRPVLTVRAVKQDGSIITLSDEIANADRDSEPKPEE